MTIKAALPRGSQDAREHVLGDGAARRAIAAATHLTSDNRPAYRVFSPVVRSVDIESKEKGEQGRPLAIEVLDEPSNVGDRRRLVQQGRQATDQAATGDCDAVRGNRPGGVAVPHVQGVLEDLSGFGPASARGDDRHATRARV